MFLRGINFTSTEFGDLGDNDKEKEGRSQRAPDVLFGVGGV